MGTAPRARAIHVLDAVILSEPWIHSYRMLHEHYPAILQHNVLYILLIIICILSKFQIPCLCFSFYDTMKMCFHSMTLLHCSASIFPLSFPQLFGTNYISLKGSWIFISFLCLKNCSSLREAYENHHSKKKEKEKNDAPLAYWARY